MYINRKTGELVEAGKLNNGDWEVNFKDRFICLTDKDFHEQYGEAMICPDDECKIMLGAEPCPHRKPHICENKGIITSEPPIGMGCPDCIPYVPKERIKYTLTQDAKRVGRTVYLGNTKIKADIVKKQSNLSKLMMSDEEIIEATGIKTIILSQEALATLKRVIEAQINHLAKSEFNLYRYQGADIYIPLSDYLKEGE